MKRFFRTTIAIALFLGVTGICSAVGTSGLQSLVDSSSAIVIAHVDSAFFDGTLHHVQLRVVLSLKGTLLPGTAVAADFAPIGPKKAGVVSGLPRGNVLFSINQDSQGLWHLAQFGPPALGLSGAYFKIADEALAKKMPLNGATPAENVAQLMAAAVEADSSQASRFLSFVQFNDAPAIFTSWSNSSSPHLRAYGLAARIAAQDAAAVVSVGTLGGADRMDSILVASTLGGYRNPDPNGVKAIGRLAMMPGADPQSIVNCAYALTAIHTKESVPYLAGLLDSPDRMVRQLAVAGLSSFVANMRIAKDGLDSAEARDEVLNPARQKSLPSSDAPFETTDTRAFLHFGPFKNDTDETPVITFWKNWYRQHQAQF